MHSKAATGTCRQGGCQAFPVSEAGEMSLQHGAASGCYPKSLNIRTPESTQALTMLIPRSCSSGSRTGSVPTIARTEHLLQSI